MTTGTAVTATSLDGFSNATATGPGGPTTGARGTNVDVIGESYHPELRLDSRWPGRLSPGAIAHQAAGAMPRRAGTLQNAHGRRETTGSLSRSVWDGTITASGPAPLTSRRSTFFRIDDGAPSPSTGKSVDWVRGYQSFGPSFLTTSGMREMNPADQGGVMMTTANRWGDRQHRPAAVARHLTAGGRVRRP